ncbi:hypothetical protein E3983_08570 [Legionella israelensis]|uniref:Uncharacterized protein n=1 Tax=Legionella israelensis TaxID=454 RepID=A0AAX1EH28_9GAMM|nr:hypothetical protein [Legionella israelensis]QBR84410.1 hypothetical protein E3983_08570 [Legionella israelensis]QBS08686.1 hypothetical protein E4T55_01720 [Legionella israelensis]
MNNNEHKLALPLEYQKMPEYFDVHNINETKNALIEKLPTCYLNMFEWFYNLFNSKQKINPFSRAIHNVN